MDKRSKRKTGGSSARNRQRKVEAALRRTEASGVAPGVRDEAHALQLLGQTAQDLEEFDLDRLVRTLSMLDQPDAMQRIQETRGLDDVSSRGALRLLREAVEEELRSRGVRPEQVRAPMPPGLAVGILNGAHSATAARGMR